MHGTGVKITVFQLFLSQQKPLILRFDLRFCAIKSEGQDPISEGQDPISEGQDPISEGQDPIVISTGLRATGLRF